ncbi:hypothetical protein SAMN05877838_3464 [Hoeflea halophila]|uniref:Uncharacterized protein n=1 Tax=Hoeflea halophila TaxID=714899 RepID=A0A286IFX8_9HYPH|nr:hypothetical protein [Hoeflea halophila]SOE18536.1 hypothetical protein SAMN05877838_3464 [Hoeflea halophila]
MRKSRFLMAIIAVAMVSFLLMPGQRASAQSDLENAISYEACLAFNRAKIDGIELRLREAISRSDAAWRELEKQTRLFQTQAERHGKQLEEMAKERDRLLSDIADKKKLHDAFVDHARQLTAIAGLESALTYKQTAGGRSIVDPQRLQYPDTDDRAINKTYSDLRSAAGDLERAHLAYDKAKPRLSVSGMQHGLEELEARLDTARQDFSNAIEAENRSRQEDIDFVPMKCTPPDNGSTEAVEAGPDPYGGFDPERDGMASCPVSDEEPVVTRPPGFENMTPEQILNALSGIEAQIRKQLLPLKPPAGDEKPTETAKPEKPAVRTSAGACGWSRETICGRFGNQAGICSPFVEAARNACAAGRQGGSTAQCETACAARAELAEAAFGLRDFAISFVEKVGKPEPDLREFQFELEVARARRVAYELDLSFRVIQIYTNADTGAIVQHDGPYFEPRPPLVHTGEIGADPLPGQVAELKRLKQREEAAAEALAAEQAKANTDPHREWRAQAISVWQNSTGGGFDACRSSGDIVAALGQCKALCQAQGMSGGPAQATDVCRQASGTLGMLMQPGVERWLSPCS